jgi:hypothetical protein
MDKLILENFRCFADRHEIPLAPFTLLVGENSSGKSTFLAAIRLAWDIGSGRGLIDFNEDPFRLGTYEQIATHRRAPNGRAKSFAIGQETRLERSARTTPEHVRAEARFIQSGPQPFLTRNTLVAGDYGLTIDINPDGPPTIAVTTPRGRLGTSAEQMRFPPEVVARFGWAEWFLFASTKIEQERTRKIRERPPDSVAEFITITSPLRNPDSRPQAFAPVRSRPRRTYDPVTDIPDPEGQHIPMMLARLLGDSRKEGAELRQALNEFGETSGLFSGIHIHRLGSEGDPFQVYVKTSGPPRNLIDVGYGVSQVLPILVEILTRPPQSTFLIQQPEVHLHPRAQAALASLFARLVKERGCRLIIETHSDYFIDRLRMDVRDGKHLSPDEVSLLYFELGKNGSTIYPIRFDNLGNVLGAPPSYRRFFLQEELRFLGGT